jgi:hypothetical protein
MPNLPAEALRLCRELNASHRLIEHLRLVHCVAFHLLEAFEVRFPNLTIDREAVLFSAATHDLGKVVHPEELSGPGDRHEEVGPALLVEHGVSVQLARFARTHGWWDREPVEFEDLLVALSDNVAVGKRNEGLEQLTVEMLVELTGLKAWEAFSVLDEMLQSLSIQTTFARTGE